CVLTGGTLDVDGAQMIVNGSATIASDTTDLNGGLLITNNSTEIDSGLFEMDSGTIDGNGTAAFSAATQLLWTSGAMTGSGVTDLFGSATIASVFIDTRTFDNFGTVLQNGTLTLSNFNFINNEAAGTWNYQDSSSIGGFGTFTNFGALISSS